MPITLSDIAFQANGSQLYDDRSQSGLWGDVILVNGVPWPVMKVKAKIYRFRFLNASISRSYRPTTSPAVPMHMVATDGGIAPKSQQISSWRHGNAERYEILIDFRGMAGKQVYLNNLSNPNNRDFDNTNKIMRFDVVADDVIGPDTKGSWTVAKVPDLLVSSEAMSLKQTSGMKVRNIRVERTNGLWALNGQTWDDVMASGYKSVLANPNLGDTEVWDIQNKSGGWFHPLHIHLVDFQILSRNGKAPVRLREGPQGRRLHRRERDRPADHEVRRQERTRAEHRQVHGPLPQPGPRGPRHDAPVQRRPERPHRPERPDRVGQVRGRGRHQAGLNPAAPRRASRVARAHRLVPDRGPGGCHVRSRPEQVSCSGQGARSSTETRVSPNTSWCWAMHARAASRTARAVASAERVWSPRSRVPTRRRRFRLQDTAAEGLTRCAPDVLTDAVEKQIEGLPGVQDASAVLRGTVQHPDLTVSVTASEQADIPALLHSLQTTVAGDVGEALDTRLKRLGVQVEIGTTKTRTDRITLDLVAAPAPARVTRRGVGPVRRWCCAGPAEGGSPARGRPPPSPPAGRGRGRPRAS